MWQLKRQFVAAERAAAEVDARSIHPFQVSVTLSLSHSHSLTLSLSHSLTLSLSHSLNGSGRGGDYRALGPRDVRSRTLSLSLSHALTHTSLTYSLAHAH